MSPEWQGPDPLPGTGDPLQRALERAEVLVAANRRDEARTTLADVASLGREDARWFLMTGSIALADHDLDEAERLLDRAISLAPEDGSSWSLRSFLSHVRGRNREGLDLARRGLEVDPTNPDLHLQAARCLVGIDAAAHGEDAEREVSESLRLGGDQEQAAIVLIEVHEANGRYREALDIARDALGEFPASGPIRAAYVRILHRDRRTRRQAEGLLQDFLGEDPTEESVTGELLARFTRLLHSGRALVPLSQGLSALALAVPGAAGVTTALIGLAAVLVAGPVRLVRRSRALVGPGGLGEYLAAHRGVWWGLAATWLALVLAWTPAPAAALGGRPAVVVAGLCAVPGATLLAWGGRELALRSMAAREGAGPATFPTPLVVASHRIAALGVGQGLVLVLLAVLFGATEPLSRGDATDALIYAAFGLEGAALAGTLLAVATPVIAGVRSGMIDEWQDPGRGGWRNLALVAAVYGIGVPVVLGGLVVAVAGMMALVGAHPSWWFPLQDALAGSAGFVARAVGVVVVVSAVPLVQWRRNRRDADHDAEADTGAEAGTS